MRWEIIINTLFRIHGARGHLKDMRSFERAVNIIVRTYHTRATSRNVSLDEAGRAFDQFQGARTTHTLRRARRAARHFANVARIRPQVPTSERSAAGFAVLFATDEHALDSYEVQQARFHFADVVYQYNHQLLDELERAHNARRRLWDMRDYYRDLRRLNLRAANVYINLCDNRALRREFAIHSGPLRCQLLAASQTFEELATICTIIARNIETARNRLDAYTEALGDAIRENTQYNTWGSNRYVPTRRDRQAVGRLA